MRQVLGCHKFQGIKVIPFLTLLLLILICVTACNPLRKEETVVNKEKKQLEKWKTCSPKEIAEHITKIILNVNDILFSSFCCS